VIRYRVRPATEADSGGIRALLARAYGAECPEEEWLWKFPRNPDGWFGVVAESEQGQIVGNFAGWPMRFVLDGVERTVYSAGDVATIPEARGLGKSRNIYGEMAEAFYEAVRRQGVPFTFGFPHPRAHEISSRLGGTRDYFPVRHLRVDCAAFSEPPPGARASDFVTESFDSLWAGARWRIGPVRDRARVNWRFHARPSRYYRMVQVASNGEDRGWAVLSVLGEEAVVADFLGLEPDGSDLVPLFAAAAREASRLGAKQLLFWSTPGAPARAVLESLPGESRDAGFWFVGRVFDEEAAQAYLERGHFSASLHDVV
jgi:predicted N-acetyltransferase YhbS